MLLYDVYLKSFVTGSKQRASLTWAVTNVSLVVVAIGMCFRFQMNVPGWLRSTGHTGALGEILLSVAASAVIFHPCLIVGEKAPKVVYLVAAMGSMSLTVYLAIALTGLIAATAIAQVMSRRNRNDADGARSPLETATADHE